MNEWMGEVHVFSTAYTFWPDGEVVSNTNLGARLKVSSDSQIATASVKGRGQEMSSETNMPMVRR